MNMNFTEIEPKEVETKALSIVDQEALDLTERARLVKITDNRTYTMAVELFKGIVLMMKKVEEDHRPNIKRWDDGHTAALADLKKIYVPLNAAKRYVKGLTGDYETEQERIRQAEQRRLEEEARKREEEARLQEAIELEASGDKEEAEAVIAEPVIVAPVILQKTTPKLEGGPVYSTRQYIRVVSVKELCLAVGNGIIEEDLVMGLVKEKETGFISSPSLNKTAPSRIIAGTTRWSKRV